MTFIDENNILVLEKNNGMVRLVSNGTLREDPVLKLQVDSEGERGLLGIDVMRNNNSNDNNSNNIIDRKESDILVYLYFTRLVKNSTNNDGDDQEQSLKNVIYRYNWDGKTLSDQKRLLELPANPGPYHNGGKLVIGPHDHQLYAVIGDLNSVSSIFQNFKEEGYNNNNNNKIQKREQPTSAILRINPADGSPSIGNPFSISATAHGNDNATYYNNNNSNSKSNNSDSSLIRYYYAYGIRNSFGLAFDPVTGNLWDTENGEDRYDEINLVKPGFNSGWYKIMGPIARNNYDDHVGKGDSNSNNISKFELTGLNGSYYTDPLFSWQNPIGITDIEFLNSSKLGDIYRNNIFVGDINNGNLYFFEVNKTRNGLDIVDSNTDLSLLDLVADDKKEMSKVTFGNGFSGRITDIETGPDGYLYILTYLEGKLYRILPS
jgi:glucose/arabinose dehydrogenase